MRSALFQMRFTDAFKSAAHRSVKESKIPDPNLFGIMTLPVWPQVLSLSARLLQHTPNRSPKPVLTRTQYD
jgi:hypothetical protein